MQKTSIEVKKIEKILYVLTSDFSQNSIPNKFNIFNQPLILKEDNYFLLPTQLMTALVYESNFIDCINKFGDNKSKFYLYNKYYDNFKYKKEKIMIDKLNKDLDSYKNLAYYETKNITDEYGNLITDLDLLILDINSNYALLCQLKYLKNTEYIYYFNTSEIMDGQEQIRKTIKNLDQFKKSYKIEISNFAFCVVTVHYIGNSNIKNDVPVILLDHLIQLIDDNGGNLKKVGEFITDYKYMDHISSIKLNVEYEDSKIFDYCITLPVVDYGNY
jgi:hypothetical protein